MSLAQFIRRLFRLPDSQHAGGVHWVNPAELQLGPYQRQVFTDEQLARIVRLHEHLAPLDGWSLEERSDLFKRDLHLDRELDICEKIAEVYEEASTQLGPLNYEQRREVYGLTIVAAGASPEEVLSHYTPKTITLDQAKRVLALFR